MCGKPRKLKFQFYNINLYDFDARAFPVDLKSSPADSHHYDKDETLGNFLVRISLYCERARD